MAGISGKTRFLGGQPHQAYENPRTLLRQIEAYFAACDEEGRHYTVAGLALFLGLRTRVLTDYPDAQAYPAHQKAIDYALQRIEAYTADKLFEGKGGTKGFEMLMQSASGGASAQGDADSVHALSDEEVRGRLQALLPRIVSATEKN